VLLRCFERPLLSLKIFQPSLTTQQNLVPQPPPNALKPRFMTIPVFKWNTCGLLKFISGHQGQTFNKTLLKSITPPYNRCWVCSLEVLQFWVNWNTLQPSLLPGSFWRGVVDQNKHLQVQSWLLFNHAIQQVELWEPIAGWEIFSHSCNPWAEPDSNALATPFLEVT